MATRYAVVSGLWSDTATWSATDGGLGGATVPADNDVVVISAGVSVLMDVDQSAFVTGIAGVTIRGAAVTPGMLYFKDGTNGYLKIKASTTIEGTNAAVYGRILANSDGVWANSTSLAVGNTAEIVFNTNAYINAQYLDIKLYCYQPATKYVRTYKQKFTVTADPDTDKFTLEAGHGLANGNLVMFMATGVGAELPSPLLPDTMYLVSNTVTATTFQINMSNGSEASVVLDITSSGVGTIEVYTGHTSTSTNVINVLDDVSSDVGWSTSTGRNAVVLCNLLYTGVDFQNVTLSAITSGTPNSMTLSSNVNSVQAPNAYIVLSSRNVSLRGYFTGTGANPVITYVNTLTTSVGIFQCELRNLSTPETTSALGIAIRYGNGIIMSGVISGFGYGFAATSNPVLSGICAASSGSGAAMSTVVNPTFSGIVFGASYAFRSVSTSVTITGGRAYGCTYVFGNCTMLSISGIFIQGVNSVLSATHSSNIDNCSGNYIQNCCNACGSVTIKQNVNFTNVSVYINVSPSVYIFCDISKLNIFSSYSNVVLSGSNISYINYFAEFSNITMLSVTFGLKIRSNAFRNNCSVRAYNTNFGAMAMVANTVSYLLTNDNISLFGIFSQDDGGIDGKITGFTSGGTLTTEAYSLGTHGSPPVSLSTIYKNTFEDSYVHGIDFKLMGRKNVPTRIKVYVKKSTASMTVSPYAKLCDPNYGFEQTGEQLAVSVAADNTDWQTLIVEYTPTYDRPLVLRVAGVNSSGYFYWNWEQCSSSSWGNTMLGG